MQARAKLEEQIGENTNLSSHTVDPDPQETAEWLEAWDQILKEENPQRAINLLHILSDRARASGIRLPQRFNTPYCNTIHVEDEVPYPGDLAMERRIKSIIRWNAMAMVV